MRSRLHREKIARACGLCLAMASCFSLLHAAAVSGVSAGTAFLQEAEAGGSTAQFAVPPRAMESRCVTMVSPHYPNNAVSENEPLVVTVHAIIRKSGAVSPVRVVSGNAALQMEAMNALRAWRYRPYERNGEPVDVVTDIRVSFEPGKPGGLISHPNR